MNDKLNEFYKSEGMAIYIKGKMVIGIHPDNLQNNIKLLNEGKMGINWGQLYDTVTKPKKVMVRMKNGKEYEITLPADENFKRTVNEIIYSDTYFITENLAIKVSEIETIVGD